MGACTNAIWVLLGAHYGDNCQMKALAAEISENSHSEVVSKHMSFIWLSTLPNIRPNGSLVGLTKQARELLTPPWPRMVITSGRRTVPAALWIRAQGAGQVRLIHVGRPWTALSRLDLVVTTAQYELPHRGNVLHNLMTLACPEGPHTKQPQPEALNTLPRPWLAVAIGGSSAPYKMDARCTRTLADRANAFTRETGGSSLILAGPRSPEKTISILRAMMSGPQMYFPWGLGLPHFADIAPVCDKILMTGDSAALLSDAAVTGKPVEICPLSWAPTIRYALVQQLRRHLPESVFSALISAGVITSVRNMPAFCETLCQAGMLHGGTAAASYREKELTQTALRCAAMLAPHREGNPQKLTDIRLSASHAGI